MDDPYILDIVYVLANCIEVPQPLELSVNKPVKDFIKQKSQEWYTTQIVEQKEDGDYIRPTTSFPLKVTE